MRYFLHLRHNGAAETIDHVNSAGSNDSDQLSEAGDESDGERLSLSVLEEVCVVQKSMRRIRQVTDWFPLH
jgi:hypothetical protein